MAFQKVEGLKRTGTVNAEVREALTTASRPGPMVRGAGTRVEIDLNRQVLFLWKGGSLARILPISSGNGESYCVKGDCDVAVTPPGSFRIGRKATGLEVAPLGELWWPMYFNGGIAIHGSPSVPAYPASHGCIRVPMYAAPTLYEQVRQGYAGDPRRGRARGRRAPGSCRPPSRRRHRRRRPPAAGHVAADHRDAHHRGATHHASPRSPPPSRSRS